MPDDKARDGNDAVSVKDWNACYNSGEDVISLSCTVASKDSSPAISGVGLILNDSKGSTLGSTYVDLSDGCQSATPALNLPPGGLKPGETVWGVVSGEVNDQHFFFEEQLVIGNC
jgi:hypothetical protein